MYLLQFTQPVNNLGKYGKKKGESVKMQIKGHQRPSLALSGDGTKTGPLPLCLLLMSLSYYDNDIDFLFI